jgi:hypothetical protein
MASQSKAGLVPAFFMGRNTNKNGEPKLAVPFFRLEIRFVDSAVLLR